jgi:hypothetical protein
MLINKHKVLHGEKIVKNKNKQKVMFGVKFY